MRNIAINHVHPFQTLYFYFFGYCSVVCNWYLQLLINMIVIFFTDLFNEIEIFKISEINKHFILHNIKQYMHARYIYELETNS